ncbi:LacI family transcriptional regulator [Streptomyces bingchenggensis BCW-1]|uniref:LacI family transcriptional regulator n=1 Tax=Streptomyces bingchenggensis (strain BCW-1) TaxID=749414 RepID=D7BUF8_STRBB|nr:MULTISPECIES: substrate-binding domain-containing protein [Streptomyces]ADI11707.1 LacI family transcriptional regulator [Streptomyces bingchenggensis BCW-1]
MFANERQEQILRQVQEQGSVRLAVLARQFGVSMVTLRRDVGILADSGLVTRVHGGITKASPDADLPVKQVTTDARQLVIGMLVPSVNYYYPAIIKGARDMAEQHGARVVLGVSRYDIDADRARVSQLIDNGASGLLLTPSQHPGIIEEKWLEALPVPTVLVERHSELGLDVSHLDTVISHHTHGAFIGARHLADLGHRKLILATRSSPSTAGVQGGFHAAVERLGLDEPILLSIDHDGPTEAQIQQTITALRAGATGALIHNDDDALMLVQHLREAGLSVPDDLSVVAYDDEVGELSDPPLTTVAPLKEMVGRRAADLLIQRLTGPYDTPVEHTLLLPELRVRASTAPCTDRHAIRHRARNHRPPRPTRPEPHARTKKEE